MQLIYSPASPFVRKVSVTLHETHQVDDIEIVNVTTTALNMDAKAVAANPTGKIPALIRDDGPAIYDSRVICRYLDHRANAGFYPEGRQWEVLTLESTADAIMESAVAIVYEAKLRPPEKQFDDWNNAQRRKITAALDAVNTRWMSHLSGPLDMSHIAMGCALGYLDFRKPLQEDWRKTRDGLTKWFETFEQRPSMQSTLPE